MADLTPDQRRILAYMAATRDEHVCAVWVAEACGHYYDTPWASAKLPGLIRRGYVTKVSAGWYAITEAGRAALLTALKGQQS